MVERIVPKTPALAERERKAIEDLQALFPDGNVAGLDGKDKALGKRLSKLYRSLGYESRADMIAALGFRQDPDNRGGRPVTVDPEALFAELQRRYEGKPKPTALGILMHDNPDLSGTIKTVQNKCNELYGHTITVELIERGLLDRKMPARVARLDDDAILDALSALEKKYASAPTRPATVAELKTVEPEYAAALDGLTSRKCDELLGTSLARYLKAKGIIGTGATVADDAVAEVLDTLQEYYRGKPNDDKPKTIAALLKAHPEHADALKAGQKAQLVTKDSLTERGILGLSQAALKARDKVLKDRCIRNAKVSELVRMYAGSGGAEVVLPDERADYLRPGVVGVDLKYRYELREVLLTALDAGLSVGDVLKPFHSVSTGWYNRGQLELFKGQARVAHIERPAEDDFLTSKTYVDPTPLKEYEGVEVIGLETVAGRQLARIRYRFLSIISRETLLYALYCMGALNDAELYANDDSWRARLEQLPQTPVFMGSAASIEEHNNSNEVEQTDITLPKSSVSVSVSESTEGDSPCSVEEDSEDVAPFSAESLDMVSKQIYEFLLDYVETHGCAPTVRAVANAAGCSVSTAHQRMGLLEAQGFISRDPGKPRAMTVAGLQSKEPQQSDARSESQEASFPYKDMADSLSGRHREAFVFIGEYIAKNGYGPSVREIADSLGVSPSTAHGEVNYLRELGFIRQEGGAARTLSIVPRNEVDEENPIDESATIASEQAEGLQSDVRDETSGVSVHPFDSAIIAQQEDSRTESLSESQKKYLAAIMKLATEGETVRAMDVADELGVSRPAVSKALASLESAGLIVRSGEGILLVPDGVDPEELRPDEVFVDAFPHLQGISTSQKKYLAVIASLDEQGQKARATDIADELGVSKPAVSRALSILECAGLIQRDGQGIHLTPLAIGEEGNGDDGIVGVRPDVLDPAVSGGAESGGDDAVTGEPGQENEPIKNGWTFTSHQRAIGRRFSVEVPDQWVLTPNEDGRPLARYEKGVDDESEYPQIICSAMAGDLDEETQATLRENVIPETRIQLSRKAIYGNDMANTLSRVVNDWVVEGKNCQVLVFEILMPSIFPGFTSDSYEYHVKPVAYDHEDFLRLADSWNHLGEGQLKELAFAIAPTVELDSPVELRRPAELEQYHEVPADADAFCELVSVISNMLNLSGSERTNANLWREIRRSNNDKGCLLVAGTMPRIQAEAYNASLDDEVAYYGRLVTALERQQELGVDGFEKMWSLVGEFGDVRVVDHVTMEDNEEAAKAVNSLGIISIPAAYQALHERWAALAPEAVQGVEESAEQNADEAARLQEEEAAQKAEAEAKRRAEEEAARKAEEEARRKADEEKAARLAEIEAARKAEAETKRRMQDARVELNGAKGQLDSLAREKEKLEAQIQEFDHQISDMRATARDLKRTETDLDAARKELDGLGFFAFGKKGELRKKIQQLEQSRKELSEKLPSDVDESIKRIGRQRDDVASERGEVEKKLAECRKRIDASASILVQPLVEKLAGASKGDVLEFGRYPQSSDRAGGEPVKWQVLEKRGDRLLLMSTFVLDYHVFNESKAAGNDYRTSDLRKWMIGGFKTQAFDIDEQLLLDGDPFIMGLKDFTRYFTSKTSRKCSQTEYAKGRGRSKGGRAFYWLSTAGDWGEGLVYYVNPHGDILGSGKTIYSQGMSFGAIGLDVNYDSGVRPAIWVKTKE